MFRDTASHFSSLLEPTGSQDSCRHKGAALALPGQTEPGPRQLLLTPEPGCFHDDMRGSACPGTHVTAGHGLFLQFRSLLKSNVFTGEVYEFETNVHLGGGAWLWGRGLTGRGGIWLVEGEVLAAGGVACKGRSFSPLRPSQLSGCQGLSSFPVICPSAMLFLPWGQPTRNLML